MLSNLSLQKPHKAYEMVPDDLFDPKVPHVEGEKQFLQVVF